MILLFPDRDALRLVVGTGGLLPPDVLLAPATVSTDGTRVAVETDTKLATKVKAELSALGVAGSRRHLGEAKPVGSWPEVLPVEKALGPPALSSAAPVLFELAAADLPDLAGELLRLGNDRQQLLTLADGRALLRVVGPPYYTLLRATDDPAGTVKAFAEAAPRVWVQLGFRHPLAGMVKPADGQMLLLAPPERWEPVPDGPFRDIYEALDLHLPAARVSWPAADSTEKLVVPLTLGPATGSDPAELWVLRGDSAEATLDQFVREADSRLLQRLKFAAADASDGRVIVVRTTGGRQAPPAVELPGATAYRPFSKLPNLFVPVGRRLAPILRRDAVRTLLADDPDQLVWLTPEGDRRFVPESVPETGFRPLAEWVEYVVSQHHQALAEWVAATTFDFEAVVCGDTDRPPKPPRQADDAPKARKPSKSSTTKPAPTAAPDETATSFVGEPVLLTPVPTPAAEWRVRRDELEKRFLAIDGPLDHPERVALWPELAVANAGAGEPGEAAICWLNAAWASDRPQAVLDRWLASEFSAGPPDIGPLLANTAPTPGEVRQAVALILTEGFRTQRDRLPAAQQFLADHEGKLPVRAAWLAAARLAELAGADSLGLVRVRDRLFARMMDDGLSPERDLPGFLRFAGLTDSERVRLVRSGAGRLHDEVRTWCQVSLDAATNTQGNNDRQATPAYVDLAFAFGLARLGDTQAAGQLTAAADTAFKGLPAEPRTRVLAAGWAADAYRYRIDQAAAGKPHTGPLPPAVLAQIEAWRNTPKAVPHQKQSDEETVAFAIDQLRYASRVLDPVEMLRPYRAMEGRSDQHKFLDSLWRLEQLPEPAVFIRRVRELYDTGDGRPNHGSRLQVVRAALPLAHRAGEAFVREMIGRVVELVAAQPPADPEMTRQYGYLLERGILLAGFYDRRDELGRLVELFLSVAKGRPDEQRLLLVNGVAVHALRSLRRLGLREQTDRLVARLPELVFGTEPATGLPAKYAARPAILGEAAQAVLAVAAGWQAVGQPERVAPLLADVERLLTGPAADKLPPKDYPAVVQAYLAAVALGPADAGLDRMNRLFTVMREPRLAKLVKNGKTAAAIYSAFHVAIAEAAVLAATGDDFALGPAGRRWLEEDEQLVRRRVNRDTDRAVKSGL